MERTDIEKIYRLERVRLYLLIAVLAIGLVNMSLLYMRMMDAERKFRIAEKQRDAIREQIIYKKMDSLIKEKE